MEFTEAIIYIIGIGFLGALVGLIAGIFVGAEQIIHLRNENERLRKSLDKAQQFVKSNATNQQPQVIEITVPIEGQNIPKFGD